MNYIYEQLRSENKLIEIKEDRLNLDKVKKSTTSFKDVTNTIPINSPEQRQSNRKNTFSYYSGSSVNATNSLVVLPIKTDKKDENYLVAKNYIKMLKQSEFYMI